MDPTAAERQDADHRKRVDLAPEVRGARPQPAKGGPRGGRTVALRAPDRAGGLPWAMLAARNSQGSTCLSAPGDRLGRLDMHLGLFNSVLQEIPRCPDPRRRTTTTLPARLSTGLYSGPNVNADSERRGTRVWGFAAAEQVIVPIRVRRRDGRPWSKSTPLALLI